MTNNRPSMTGPAESWSEKQDMRKQIAEQTQVFLKNGGKIRKYKIQKSTPISTYNSRVLTKGNENADK